MVTFSTVNVPRKLRSLLLTCAVIALLGGTVGAALGTSVAVSLTKSWLIGAMAGFVGGFVDIGCLAVLVIGTEIYLPQTRLDRALAQAPFVISFVIKSVLYLGSTLSVVYMQPGQAAIAALGIGGAAGLELLREVNHGYALKVAWIVTVANGLAILLIYQLILIVGARNVRDIVLGRYHTPRCETRFVLFVDIVGSTALAERLGAAAMHRLLNRVFQVIDPAIDLGAGEVYQYVGDQIVITWPVAVGCVKARPIACFFAIDSALSDRASAFENEFGCAPGVRGALHAGEVIVGEVGGYRRAIVLHGDTLNTTARLEQLAKELAHPLLLSRNALDRFQGITGYTLHDLGMHTLRGRVAPLAVFAVDP